MSYIYGLTDPLDPGIVRYVGYTLRTLNGRLRGHMGDARRGVAYPVHVWIRELIQGGRSPLIVELQEVDSADVRSAERRWIRRLRSPLLLNVMDGGTGPSRVRSPEYCANLSAAMRLYWEGRVVSDETREKLRQAAKGAKATPEARAKMSASRRGKKHSPESKKKMSLASKKAYIEGRVGDGLAKCQTPEARARSAESHRGQKRSDKARSNMSKTTPEVRQKYRDAANKRWSNNPEEREKYRERAKQSVAEGVWIRRPKRDDA